MAVRTRRRWDDCARAHTVRLPVLVKTRRKSVTPDGTPGLLCQSSVGRQETAIFLLQAYLLKKKRILITHYEIYIMIKQITAEHIHTALGVPTYIHFEHKG
jgi:hypothetical protein